MQTLISIFDVFLIFLMFVISIALGAFACWLFLRKRVEKPKDVEKDVPESIAELLADIPGNASKLSQIPKDDLTDMQKQFLNFARYDGTPKGQIDV